MPSFADAVQTNPHWYQYKQDTEGSEPAGAYTLGAATPYTGGATPLFVKFMPMAMPMSISPADTFNEGNAAADIEITMGAGMAASPLHATDLETLSLGASGLALGNEFTTRDGSIIITLNRNWLNTLPQGTHTFTMTLSGPFAGDYTAVLTVGPRPPAPPAGRVNPNTGCGRL